MQRVRMSLPYFKEFGWDVEVVSVAQIHSDINKDPLLAKSLPRDLTLHEVQAFSKSMTSKLGLGSIALRSIWFFKKEVNRLLRKNKIDLIYFSTTQFPVCILGSYWKRKFGVPYVIDMQDPWHSEYYQDKPKTERPPKYWFSYRLNKFLEPLAMKAVSGLISVSESYIKTLKQRYPVIKDIPSSVITFGAFEPDFKIAQENISDAASALQKKDPELSIVYVGRGGKDMEPALRLVFEAFNLGLKDHPLIFRKFKFYFIGTSYAAAGEGKQTVKPLADTLGLGEYVFEHTDRISFYKTLNTLKSADVLFIPGSDDPQYTASKIYPYLMAEKPLISIFHPASSAAKIIEACGAGLGLTFDTDKVILRQNIVDYLIAVYNKTVSVSPPEKEEFNKYSARNMVKAQVDLFNKVLELQNIK